MRLPLAASAYIVHNSTQVDIPKSDMLKPMRMLALQSL